MSKKLKLLIVLGLSLAAGCGSPAPAAEQPTQPLESVRLVMGFRPDVQFSPLYMASARGYFEEAGIDIEFEHMAENEALRLVGAGELPFAVASGEQVLLARSQSLPVKYVMAWWQDYPVAIAAPAGSGIEEPGDLVGKKVGLPGLYGASYIGLRALLSQAGISEDQLTLDSIEYTQVESLLAGREDAVVVYANNEPLQLTAQGMDVHVIRVADYVHLASNGLVTGERVIEQRPDLVRRMVSAFLKGLEDVIEDPEAAYEVSTGFVEGLNQLDPDQQQRQLQIIKESIPLWTDGKLGHADPEAWENMHQVLLQMDLLEKPVKVEAAYTNEFLP